MKNQKINLKVEWAALGNVDSHVNSVANPSFIPITFITMSVLVPANRSSHVPLVKRLMNQWRSWLRTKNRLSTRGKKVWNLFSLQKRKKIPTRLNLFLFIPNLNVDSKKNFISRNLNVFHAKKSFLLNLL